MLTSLVRLQQRLGPPQHLPLLPLPPAPLHPLICPPKVCLAASFSFYEICQLIIL